MLAAGLLLVVVALAAGDVGAFTWRQVTARAAVALSYPATVGLVIGLQGERLTATNIVAGLITLSGVFALVTNRSDKKYQRA
jgi:hypothetical protein